MTGTVIFPGGRVFLPFDFWTTELIAGNTSPEFTGTFRFHGKGWIIRTAGDTVLIHRIILIFQTGSNVSLLEMPVVFAGICAKGSIGKKFFIKRNRVKRRVTQKGVRVDKGMGGKKILFKAGRSSLASWTDLSSYGESDFLLIMISGCLSKKSLHRSRYGGQCLGD